MDGLKILVSGNEASKIDPEVYAHILKLIDDYVTKQEEGNDTEEDDRDWDNETEKFISALKNQDSKEEEDSSETITPFTFMTPYNYEDPSVVHYTRNEELEKSIGLPRISSDLNTMHQYVDAYNAIPYKVHESHAKFIEKVLFGAWDFYNNHFIKPLTNGKELEINVIPSITNNKLVPASEPYPRFPEFSAYFFSDMITLAYLMADHEPNPSKTKLDSYHFIILKQFEVVSDNITKVLNSDIINALNKAILSKFDLTLDDERISVLGDYFWCIKDFRNYLETDPYRPCVSDGDTIPKLAFLYGSHIKNFIIQKLRSRLLNEYSISNKDFSDLIFSFNLKIMPTIYDYIQHTLFEIAMHASFTYALMDAVGIHNQADLI